MITKLAEMTVENLDGDNPAKLRIYIENEGRVKLGMSVLDRHFSIDEAEACLESVRYVLTRPGNRGPGKSFWVDYVVDGEACCDSANLSYGVDKISEYAWLELPEALNFFLTMEQTKQLEAVIESVLAIKQAFDADPQLEMLRRRSREITQQLAQEGMATHERLVQELAHHHLTELVL